MAKSCPVNLAKILAKIMATIYVAKRTKTTDNMIAEKGPYIRRKGGEKLPGKSGENSGENRGGAYVSTPGSPAINGHGGGSERGTLVSSGPL
jgi:hypothetical protein